MPGKDDAEATNARPHSRAATQTPTSLGVRAHIAAHPQHHHTVPTPSEMATEAPQPVEAITQDAPQPDATADAAQKPPVKRSWRYECATSLLRVRS